jgi:L-threonylcarbamoyladenylate synthase
MYKTQYLKINPQAPEPQVLEQAAQFIRAGELVAFPTDTVYGLGADATNSLALEKIFIAKGRPQDRPLLVHVSSIDQLKKMAGEVSPTAELLIKEFWPGPLAIIMSGKAGLSAAICGADGTVGFRMPDNIIAREFIAKAGPIAAPSANLTGRPSPTNAQHVKEDLDGRISAVLDAGAIGLGVESTIIDISREEIIILRRGGISVEAIEQVLQKKVTVKDVSLNASIKVNCQVVLSNIKNFSNCLEKLKRQNKRIGLASFHRISEKIDVSKQYLLNPTQAENSFYSVLREAEKEKLEVLLVVIPEGEIPVAMALTIDKIKRAVQ